MRIIRKCLFLVLLLLVFSVNPHVGHAKTVSYTGFSCPDFSQHCFLMYFERSWGPIGSGYWNAFTDPSGFSGILAPKYTVTYQANVVNAASGTDYPDGSAIPGGTNIILKFPAAPPPPQVFQQWYSFSGNGIAWEYANDLVTATGGRWVAGAADPRACTVASADWPVIVQQRDGGLPLLSTLLNETEYITFPFAPPALSVSGVAGMACGALVGNQMSCTTNAAGPYSVTFNYGATIGYAYESYKYDTLTNTTSLACQSGTSDSGPLHYGDETGFGGFGADSGGGIIGNTSFNDLGRISNLSVPAQNIKFNFAAAAQPNLTIFVDPTQTTATPGVPVTFTATVKNVGAAATPNTTFTNIFQIDNDANHNTLSLATSTDPTPSPGNMAVNATDPTASTPYTFASAGTYYVRACADENVNMVGVIAESNEGDNCGNWITVTVSYPPVTGSCTVAPTTGTTATSFTWTAAGASGGTGSGYTYAWTGTNLTGQTGISYTVPLGSYAIGGPYTGSVTITDGGGNSSVPIACSNQITSVTAVPQPDLTAGSVSPTAATAGSPTTFSATVSNTGAASTGAGFTDLFQSATDALGTGAATIGTYASAAIANGSNNSATLSYTFPSAGTMYVRVCADSGGVITESNEGNNCGAWTAVTITNTPITGVSCTVAPTTGTTAQAFTWTSTAASGGNGGPYTYTWSGTNLTGHTGISYTVPGGSYAVGGPYTGSVTVTDGAGDTSGSISCSNQITSVTALKPDLTASNVTSGSALVQGVANTLSATISNSNVAATGAGFTDLFQIANDAAGTGAADLAPTYANAALAVNGTNGATISYTPASAGTFYYRACADKSSAADANGVISESNEGNNCSGVWTAITVSPPAQPDLTVIGTSAVVVASSGTVSLPATVKNQGAANSVGAFSTFYWVDTDSTHDANPATWGTQSAAIAGSNPLAPLGTQNVAQNWTAPAVGAPTTYYYQYCTDWFGTITESLEGNNCSGWQTITISAAPVVGVCAATHYNCTAGTSINNVNGGAAYTWTCQGLNGGADSPQCSEPKAAPSLTCDRAPLGDPLTAPVTVTYTAVPQNGATAPYTFKDALNNVLQSGPSLTYQQTYAVNGGPYAVSVTASNVATPVACGTSFAVGGACGSPTPAITASQTRVVSGNPVLISWTASGVTTSCVLTDQTGTTLKTSSPGACSVNDSYSQNITKQTTFTITCDSNAATAKSITINVVPKIIEF